MYMLWECVCRCVYVEGALVYLVGVCMFAYVLEVCVHIRVCCRGVWACVCVVRVCVCACVCML